MAHEVILCIQLQPPRVVGRSPTAPLGRQREVETSTSDQSLELINLVLYWLISGFLSHTSSAVRRAKFRAEILYSNFLRILIQQKKRDQFKIDRIWNSGAAPCGLTVSLDERGSRGFVISKRPTTRWMANGG